MVTGRSDRAQLILVGAIALAFIILALVVVFNGVLYTQSISSGNDLADANSAEKGSLEVRRGLAGLVQHVNAAENETDQDALDDAINRSVESFASNYSNVSSRSGGHITNVKTTNHSDWDHGRIVDQETTAEFTNSSGEGNWEVYNNTADARDIRHFVMTIDAESDIDGFEIEVNESGPTIGFSHDDGEIEIDGCSGSFATRTDGTVRIDFTTGSVNGNATACDPWIEPAVDGPYEQVRFSGGRDVEGTYEIVFKSGNNLDGFDREPDAAALEIQVDYWYRSDGVSVDRTLAVDVYGGDA